MAEPAKKRGRGSCAPLAGGWERDRRTGVSPAALLRPASVSMARKAGLSAFHPTDNTRTRKGKDHVF